MYVCLLKESTSILKAAIKKNNKISNCAIFVTAMALFIERPMYIVAFFLFICLFGFFFKLYPAVYFFGYILSFYYLLCLFIEIHVKTVLAPVIRLLLRLYGGYYICTRSIITEFENVYMHVLHTIS